MNEVNRSAMPKIRMKTGLKTGLAVFAVLLMMACGDLEHLKEASLDSPRESAYEAALNQWTREARIYKDLEMVVRITATYETLAYRLAYAAEFARRYQLSAADAAKMEQDQRQAASEFNDFFIVVYTPDEDLNNLGLKNAAWKIYLKIGAQKRLTPLEIRKVRKIDARTRYFLPHLSVWNTLYRARFPSAATSSLKVAKATPATLMVTGVGGTTELHWE